jgi:hypothetical protein
VVGPGGPSDVSLINSLAQGLGKIACTDIQEVSERPPKPSTFKQTASPPYGCGVSLAVRWLYSNARGVCDVPTRSNGDRRKGIGLQVNLPAFSGRHCLAQRSLGGPSGAPDYESVSGRARRINNLS